MSYVGLDIDKCSQLKAHLDAAAADIRAHADRVQALLVTAGIQSCQAPGELRDVAAWADYRSRDLQKRIDRARAAEQATRPRVGAGFALQTPDDARKAGIKEAKKLTGLVRAGKDKDARAELDRLRAHASDPNFAAGFLGQLGPEGLAALLHMLAGDGERNRKHPEDVLRDMGFIAGMLAGLSNGSDADRKLANKLLNRLRKPDLVGELAVLLSFGGFSSKFTADACRSILGANASAAAIAALAVMGLTHLRPRDIALQALGKDPEAAYLYVTRASMDELRALLDDPGDMDGGALAAKVLQTGLLDARATHPGDLKHIEDALERVMLAIAKGAPLTNPARLAVAKALYPELVSGTVALQAALQTHGPSTADGFNVSKENMERVFAELMKNDKSRAELQRGISDYMGAELAKAISAGKDVPGALMQAGSLLGVVTIAERKYLHGKATSDDFALGVLRDAGHIAVGAISKYTGPAAPVTAAVGDHLVDKGVGGIEAGKAAKEQTDAKAADDAITVQVRALLAQAYYAKPEYRALVTSPLPKDLQDADGNLKAITPGTPDANRFYIWLKQNTSFMSAIADDEQKLDTWIHDQLLRG